MADSMNNINILFLFKPGNDLKMLFNCLKNDFEEINLVYPENLDDENMTEYYKNADIMIGWRPSEKLLENADRLSLFIHPGAGIKHLISTFSKLNEKRKVILVNGHGNSYFTAQHTVALLLTLTNKIILHHQYMKNGSWRTGDEEGASIPLKYSKIGLLGYGHIGKKVHSFLAAFDPEFHILSRSPKTKITNDLPCKAVYSVSDIDIFLKKIDMLIIMIPQTHETEGLIAIKELSLLGPESLLVNVARGEIIKEADLYKALKEKIIKAAAIDVWYNYNPAPDGMARKLPYSFPFHELDNVILSPHRAASPFSDLNRWQEVFENISRFAKGEKHFLNEVDLKKGY
ncbi:MAG: hypothetical protein JXA60_05705 [Candidatus Coatesbacteria bacterium]|nr:hypothetical protein [Candidatus Coatesbacteria bacterium]